MNRAIGIAFRAAVADGMIAAICVAGAAKVLAASNDSAAPSPAGVTEDDAAYTLSNGIVTARVSKRSGDLTSLEYHGLETLASNSGHPGGYWSHDVSGGAGGIKTAITIEPKTNGGDRGEVSIKGISGGKKMGHGAGAAPDGNFPADIEIRYSLGRGESGIYTYCIFDHLPEYPAGSMGEARFLHKLAECFDWMTLDNKRNMAYPKEVHEGDKYIYTAVQFDHPVYGWSSPTNQVGFWLVNPTVEYLSGGPTKTEFLCHRDTTQVAAPCVHNYWRSSHYGGAMVECAQGEHWTKVIGPFFLYVNAGPDPQAMWQAAQAFAAKERERWPYDWVVGVDYPRRDERATVSGTLVLDDPQLRSARTPNLMVGLTHAAYPSPNAGPGGRSRQIDWQIDAKHYEFWARGDEDDSFRIPNVRPGTYTLHAFADSVLGELVKTNVTVEAGKPLDLGNVTWRPVRRGVQLWDVGIPNRNGSEFFKAEEVADPEISLKYPVLFPDDVNYVIGKSDYRKDWFFQQVPHNEDPTAQAVPYLGIRGNGRATPFRILFDLANAPHGTATLRVAICATGARQIDVLLNDKPVGQIDRLVGDGAITRHSIQGIWYERELAFDASLMKQGTNVLQLIVPAGPVNSGIIYDYVRLELDQNKPPLGTSANAASSTR